MAVTGNTGDKYLFKSHISVFLMKNDCEVLSFAAGTDAYGMQNLLGVIVIICLSSSPAIGSILVPVSELLVLTSESPFLLDKKWLRFAPEWFSQPASCS